MIIRGAEMFGDGLALVKQLLSGEEFAVDLYSFGEACGYVDLVLAFHGASPGKICPVGILS